MSYQSALRPYQQAAVDFHRGVLKKYNGTILKGVESSGKTIMSMTLAGDYENVLFVTQAKFVENTKKKQEDYISKFGIGVNVEVVSYHAFANPKKVKLADYDFVIMDEAQVFSNYKTKWTERFIRDWRKQFLLMSATPIKKSVREFMYVIRKTGAFGKMSTEEYRIRYLSGRKSRFGDFLEIGSFINVHEFTQNMNKVTHYISQEDIDKDIPKANIVTHQIEGTWTKAECLEEETLVRRENGLKKVVPASRFIAKEIREKNIDTCIILCHFHAVAKKLAEELKYPLALESKKVVKEVQRIKEKGGFLITTLGLTGGSYDINECDHMYLVESNYHWASDRQSIRRCQRIGKRTVLNVTYITLEGEAPYLKAARDAWTQEVGEVAKHSPIGPSSLENLERCPGSFWLPDTSSTDFLAPYGAVGTNRHEEAERLLRTGEELTEAVSEDVGVYVAECRKLIKTAVKHGIEDRVAARDIHQDLFGTVDFWSWDGKTLTVIDYKNGNKKVEVEENLQLEAYAYMVCMTHKIKPEQISLNIIQKTEKKTRHEPLDVLYNTRRRLNEIVENINKAKSDPKAHLSADCKSITCRAFGYHQKEKSRKQ